MWTSKGFPQAPETSSQNDSGYIPPEKKSKKSPENNYLKEALECCKNQEIGIEEASLIYGVPKRSLRAKLKDSNSSVIDEKYTVIVLSVYPAEAEADLAAYLEDCVSSLITMTATEVRRFAYELVCEKYKLTNFPMEKNCILGQRWLKTFIEKYPHLDVRSEEIKVKEDKSTDFYNTLESFVKEFKISDSQIYSVDGVELKYRASWAEDMKLLPKTKTIYANRKAICCTSPVGNFVPPVFLNNDHLNIKNIDFTECDVNLQKSNRKLNKGFNKLKQMIKNIPHLEDLLVVEKQIMEHLSNKKLQLLSEEEEEELREKLYEQFVQLKNKIISKSESSVNEITPEIFYTWLTGFINYVKPNHQRKVLLLLPNENYIKSFKILELGKKNGVIFLVLPPHSIHKIYPLDGFSMSLNRNLSTSTRRWHSRNNDFNSEEIPLEVIFMEAFAETINPLIAKNGFVYSGIWPINRNIFESTELGGECVLLVNKSKFVNSENCSLSTVDLNLNDFTLAGIRNEGDIKKLCRVCLKEKMHMKPLLEILPSGAPNYHGKKMSEILKVPISHGDGLPNVLCQYCLVQLIDTIKVREMAVESHKKQLKLREALDRIYFEDEESENHELLCLFQSITTQLNDSKIINRVISKNFDINSICRICMGEKPLMTSIFFRPQGGVMLCSGICNRIMQVSHCQVRFHDGLSSSICPFCLPSINKASKFIQRVLGSDKILREIVSHFRSKT